MIPKSHPRYISLRTRDRIVKGVKLGITSIHGLIAQGRGEAFDYLIDEKTQKFAMEAIKASASLLLIAKKPVISVNGNAAALCPNEMVKLSKMLGAPLEVNIFHKSKKRELAIKKWLIKKGAKQVLLPHKGIIRYIDHNRRYCNENGIEKADVVFVPLEDGDRCKALRRMDKKVITIDLNPMSRTAQNANATIVDNIVRSLPLIVKEVERYRKVDKKILYNMIKKYNNRKILKQAVQYIKR
jgi:4-phosphopantoate--beta-alanine ligase